MMALSRSSSDALPPALPPAHADEWRALGSDDRRLLTPDVLERWTTTLAPDDYTLRDLAQYERRRRSALATLRAEAQLTELELRFVRYLQRNEGRTLSYLHLARHLWSTPQRTITAKMLRPTGGNYGYSSTIINQIHQLAHNVKRKLEIDPLRPQHLCNIRGVGYRWYANPPSLDDGEDYGRRAVESSRQREFMVQVLGIVEGEYTRVVDDLALTDPPDQFGEPFETRYVPRHDRAPRALPESTP